MDAFSWTLGVHQFKIGIDYRRLTPSVGNTVGWGVFPSAFTSIAAGTAGLALLNARDALALKMSNYSLFAQDTWKTSSRAHADLRVAMGDQYPAGLGNVRAATLHSAGNLRFEPARAGAGGSMAHEIQ